MSSHNSAISSRTDLNSVVSSQSLYIATLVGRLCCTRLLIHYNASLLNLYMIIFSRPEGASVSLQSLIIFCHLHRVIHHLLLVRRTSRFVEMLYMPMRICLPGGRIRLPFNYYITYKKSQANLPEFKYVYELDLQQKRDNRITKRLCWICVYDYKYN